ncbi:csgAB operon transcriptional regulatory protein [Aeromonas encheleia]|uniref:LuxR C-terminal-related transcriptional regulator n=1 Tax=Aeromonas encheleia TaxID=73010 RepID=UPI000ADDB069|nr:LuxR C-terminal-related transcriptional regulator [Aeromonas encheleia]VEG98262.1 csgAB operon transcriptional regulatory protein [Aeromonas encheleia]
MTPEYPLVLITEHNAQAISFQRHLGEQLGLAILLVGELDALPEPADTDSQSLFMIDLDYLKSTQQADWSQTLCSRFGGASTVLLNAPTSTDRELLLMWPHTSGLFFRQDSLDRLVIGIGKVLQGEYWIPRHLLCDLVDYYRKGSGQPLRNQTLLTAREQEIVRHLMTGASNTEIADSLFVSEHTIKSHLYNVFKKLNVKNRLQAVSWAKEYL